MATFVAGQPYTGKVIDPSQGGAIVDYRPSIGDTSQAQQQQQSGVQMTSPAITPSALTPAKPLQPVTPAPTPTPTVPDFLALTQPEKQAQDQYLGISSAIASLTGELAGRDAYTTGQQQQQDIIGKQSAVNNYQNQLKALQQEATGINLNSAQQQQEIQAAAQAGGANVTKGGLSPQYQAVKTQNTRALLDNAVKQYSVGAQLSAAQGDLTSALNYVDQAVKLKYQPIEAQLTAQQANLQAIQNSPNFTSAQKKQAAALELQNKTYLDSIATEKENAKSVQALALQALQNGAPEPIVNKIYNSKDLGEAMGYATGYAQKETVQSIQEYNFYAKQEKAAGRTPVSYNEYQNMDANRKAAVARAGVAKTATGLPSNIATQVDKLSSSFDSSPIVKNYNEVQNKKLSVDSILQTGIKGPADLALVYEFMKALDPTSVVRETEYSTAAASGNIFSGMYAKYNGYLTEGGGFLPEQVKRDFQTIIDKKFNVATSQYDNLRKETARKINLKTGSEDGVDYLTDYGAAVPASTKETKSTLSAPIQQKIQSQITIEGQNAYLPKAVWDSLGADKDAVLAEAAADGYKLLIR